MVNKKGVSVISDSGRSIWNLIFSLTTFPPELVNNKTKQITFQVEGNSKKISMPFSRNSDEDLYPCIVGHFEGTTFKFFKTEFLK